MDCYDPEEIKHRLTTRTFDKLANELVTENNGARGFSVKSLKRFCQQHNIKKRPCTMQLSDREVDVLVETAISQVGPSYGKRMMKGYLDSTQGGMCVASEARVRASLNRVSTDEAKTSRSWASRRIENPHIYQADYFGEKWHIDQNEKLIRYGVTVVAMIDGYSRLIVGTGVMETKNNVIIYNDVYCEAILKYGLPTQLRSDHGLEFCLIQDVQQRLSDRRLWQNKVPVACTASKSNMPIERFWCEVNVRILYPIKKALVNLEDTGILQLPLHKSVVSFLCQSLVKIGLNRCIDAWNCHFIRGRGKPNILAIDKSKIYSITQLEVPSAEEAVEAFDGQITLPIRPCERVMAYVGRLDLEATYSDIVNGDYEKLASAMTTYEQML